MHEVQTEPEVIEAAPKEGTLAWLQLQEHVEVDGLEVPVTHRIPPAAVLVEADGSHCRVSVEGKRCGARPTRAYGVCLAHLGGGGWRDAAQAREHAHRSHAARAVLRSRRQLLAVGPRRAADPRQVARLAAQERSDAIAAALLEPLDDVALGSLARQRAAVTILDATAPLSSVSVEVQLPADAAGVQALSWQQLQQLAAQLQDEDEYQPVPALSQG